MAMTERTRELARLIFFFCENKLSLAGTILTTASGITLAWFWLLEMMSPHPMHPYTGILFFLVFPGIFFMGLALIPLGMYLRRRKLRRTSEIPEAFPKVDLASPLMRRGLFVVLGATALNILILGTASFKGVEYMDSTQFCGQACHSVMSPEYAAYKDSPHARVACTQCHIGPGAGWFVKSKLSGTRQLFAVAFNTYSRPIPSPVEHLRPARETCEQCHWPEKFVGDRVKIITHYRDDEANTPAKTVLALHLGGGGQGKGIHSWHISPDKQTFYTAVDAKRQEMAKVRVVQKDGKETVYSAAKDAFTPEQLAGAKERQMDCIDCHNRPSHIFKLPATEVDSAMEAGRIDATLPFIKKVGVETLTEAKGGENDLSLIDQKVRGFYTEKYPDLLKSTPERVDAAIVELQTIWKRNVFPKMGLTWGTHPNNLGHEQFPGCFRCHDDKLQDATGKPVGQDCEACHKVLAWDETNPEILQQLGL